MEDNGFTIWRDVPIICKDRHGKYYYGDVPVGVIGVKPQGYFVVENTRGHGYAGRNRMKYRNRKNRPNKRMILDSCE